MLKIKSYAFNALYASFLLFAYNYIFIKKLYDATDSITLFLGVLGCIWLALLLAVNLLFWPKTTKVLASVFVFFNAVGLYFMQTYNIAIDKIMLINLLNTDVNEAGDIFSVKLCLFILFAAVLPIIVICKTKIEFGTFKKEALQRIAVVVSVAVVLVSTVLLNYKSTAQFLRNNRALKYQLLPINYSGAIISAAKIIKRKNHKFVTVGTDAKLEQYWHNGKKNLLVLVVGETARAQNFSLGEYQRATNKPLDKYKEDIYYFSKVKSCGTSTAISLPCMFSANAKSSFATGSEVYTENLLDIVQRGGYKVLWRENNSGCQKLCNRVETEEFCDNYKCADEILLQNFAQKVQSNKQNMLVVLHQQGSHGPAYYNRYPPEFAVYQPTCNTNELDKCSNEQIVNTYDNSILYSSYVVAQTIEKLKNLSEEYNVIMLYASDHGESLGEKGLFLHAAPYSVAPKEQTDVPMLMWLDEKSAKVLKIDRKCLKKQLSKPFSHDNLFHTVLGLTGVKTAVYQPQLDILAGCRQGD